MGHNLKVETDRNLPSAVWEESAPLGQMCEAGFWAIGETNSHSQWCNSKWVMSLFSKSEQILGSNCIPDLSGHPQVRPPILWQRAPSRGEIRSHINHSLWHKWLLQICDYNNTKSALCMASVDREGRDGRGPMCCPVSVYNSAPEHWIDLTDAAEDGIKSLSLVFIQPVCLRWCYIQ